MARDRRGLVVEAEKNDQPRAWVLCLTHRSSRFTKVFFAFSVDSQDDTSEGKGEREKREGEREEKEREEEWKEKNT